ncbi:MAG: hypothetical protein RSD05_00620 [Comamonas sp.]
MKLTTPNKRAVSACIYWFSDSFIFENQYSKAMAALIFKWQVYVYRRCQAV